MANVCTICRHPERRAIDKALAAEGLPLRAIAEQYGVAKSTLIRHRDRCLPVTLAGANEVAREVKAEEEANARHALDIVDQLRKINQTVMTALDNAERSGDTRLMLLASDRVLRQIDFQARLLGELGAPVNIFITPQWIQVRAALVTALMPYPDAREAVSSALVAAEAS